MLKKLVLGVMGVCVATSASASLILNNAILISAQGFGAVPRNLTIQETGPGQDGTESGCVGRSGGNIAVGTGACQNADAVILPDLIPIPVFSTGGDEASPPTDNQKFGTPTLASLGITNASQIAILFNATEPGGDSVNVTDLTLTFFNGNTFLTSIDGSQNFASTNPGNGVAGFVFVVDLAQQALLNIAIFSQANFGSFFLGLESTITGVGGGPESFVIFNRDGGGPLQQIPEPGTLALLAFGALAWAGSRMRRRPQ